MGSVILGWVLIVVGLFFILLGFARAVQTPPPRRVAEALGEGGLAGIISALTKFVEALARAPQWLALTIVGVLLVVIGARLALPGALG